MEEWRTSLDHSTSYLITDEGTTFPEPPIKLEGCIKSPIFHPSSKRLQPVISITPQVATTENGSLLLSSTSRLEIDYHHRFERNIHSPIRCNLTSNFHRKRKKAFNVSLPLHSSINRSLYSRHQPPVLTSNQLHFSTLSQHIKSRKTKAWSSLISNLLVRRF